MRKGQHQVWSTDCEYSSVTLCVTLGKLFALSFLIWKINEDPDWLILKVPPSSKSPYLSSWLTWRTKADSIMMGKKVQLWYLYVKIPGEEDQLDPLQLWFCPASVFQNNLKERSLKLAAGSRCGSRRRKSYIMKRRLRKNLDPEVPVQQCS